MWITRQSPHPSLGNPVVPFRQLKYVVANRVIEGNGSINFLALLAFV